MPKDENYYFHQTPETLCKALMKHIPDLKPTDLIFEPFAGEGAWIRAFSPEQNVIQTEIEHGTDYKTIDLEKSLVENGEPGLNADTSIEDVAKSLAGLAAGDGALAGKGYERLVTRWRRVASFEQAM